jgi:hypothetical protein
MISKKLVLLIAVLAIGASLFAGGQKEAAGSPDKDAPKPAAAPLRLSVVTGPVGGTMYAVSGAWADVVNRSIPGVQITNQVGGGSAYCARVLGNKEADFGMVGNDIAFYAYTGQSVFENNAHPEFRGVAALYAESFHIAVRRDSGIKKLEELVGKSVAVGPPGSGTLLNSERVLESYNLKPSDVGAKQLGFVESAEYLRDGHVQAAFYMTGLPYGPVVDVSVTQPVDILGLSADSIRKLTQKFPFLVSTRVPADTYKGMQPVDTVSVKMLLLTTDKMSDEAVYNVTKALFENLDRMKASHAAGAGISLENATQGIPLPLHPGAEKFYREKGVLK